MNTPLNIVLDFVERWNKNDAESNVAQAAIDLKSNHDELLEAAKRILKTEDFDIESQHSDCKCSFCCLFKAIAKAELTAGEEKE